MADIDVGTVKLNGTIPAELHPMAIGDHDQDSIRDLMVKFDRQALIQSLAGQTGDVTLTIEGEVVGSNDFQGTATIMVIGS